MKNKCKGFVLLETLIVAVFMIGIFTFLYSAVIPLLGSYEDLTNKSNIDVVYKLYHLRELLYVDENYEDIVDSDYGTISCDAFSNSSACNSLISGDFLDLGSDYEILYTGDISNLSSVKSLAVSDTLKDYINNYSDADKTSIILLYDAKTDSVAHLAFTIL